MNTATATARLGAGVLLVTAIACGGSEPAPQEAPALPPDVVVLSEAQVRAAGIRSELVEPVTVSREIEVPGSVHPPDTSQVVVGSIVEGRIVAVLVLPGDVVRQGQPLMEIHTHELGEAQRDLTSATAEVTFRRNAYARSEELLAHGAVSLEEVERRRADLEAAQAELRRAEEMVEHMYPSAEGNATAVASRDGTIFDVHVRVGEAVLPGEPLVEMGSTERLWVTAFVPEQTASVLDVGDAVKVRFGTAGLQVAAHLVRAANSVNPANRSVEMRFELDEVPPGVRPGSFAVVSVTTSAPFEGLELSGDAAVRLGEQDVVFVRESPGRYRAVTVDAAPIRDQRVAVRGVPEGSEVVVEGAYFLKAQLELEADAELEAGGGA